MSTLVKLSKRAARPGLSALAAASVLVLAAGTANAEIIDMDISIRRILTLSELEGAGRYHAILVEPPTPTLGNTLFLTIAGATWTTPAEFQLTSLDASGGVRISDRIAFFNFVGAAHLILLSDNVLGQLPPSPIPIPSLPTITYPPGVESAFADLFLIDPAGRQVPVSAFLFSDPPLPFGIQPGIESLTVPTIQVGKVPFPLKIPEPSTFSLLALGALGLLAFSGFAWRQRKRAPANLNVGARQLWTR